MTALTLATTACSSPPGPGPGNPAPKIPADAVAYDDLQSAAVERPSPYKTDCSQLTPRVVAAAGLTGSARMAGGPGQTPVCIIQGKDGKLDQLWVQSLDPNPKKPTRVFPAIWNGAGGVIGTDSRSHFRRFLLLDKYYATENFYIFAVGPSCFINVDTGSLSAIQFRGIISDNLANTTYKALTDSTAYYPDIKEVDKFSSDVCPAVEKAAETFMGAIDPNGGSLATS
jgi:hypothetical protein